MAGACRLDAVLIGPLMTAQGVARHMGQRKPNAIATNSERLLLAVGFSTLAGPDSATFARSAWRPSRPFQAALPSLERGRSPGCGRISI